MTDITKPTALVLPTVDNGSVYVYDLAWTVSGPTTAKVERFRDGYRVDFGSFDAYYRTADDVRTRLASYGARLAGIDFARF